MSEYRDEPAKGQSPKAPAWAEPLAPPWKALEAQQGPTWRRVRRFGTQGTITVLEDGFQCLRCWRISYHPQDLQHRFCGHCRVHHHDGQRGLDAVDAKTAEALATSRADDLARAVQRVEDRRWLRRECERLAARARLLDRLDPDALSRSCGLPEVFEAFLARVGLELGEDPRGLLEEIRTRWLAALPIFNLTLPGGRGAVEHLLTRAESAFAEGGFSFAASDEVEKLEHPETGRT